MINCKVYEKKYRYDSYKWSYEYSLTCSKVQKCDTYIH